MKPREAMILVVMNAILAIAWRSLKNSWSGLRRSLNQVSYTATGDRRGFKFSRDKWINGRNDIYEMSHLLNS